MSHIFYTALYTSHINLCIYVYTKHCNIPKHTVTYQNIPVVVAFTATRGCLLTEIISHLLSSVISNQLSSVIIRHHWSIYHKQITNTVPWITMVSFFGKRIGFEMNYGDIEILLNAIWLAMEFSKKINHSSKHFSFLWKKKIDKSIVIFIKKKLMVLVFSAHSCPLSLKNKQSLFSLLS